MNRQMTPVYQTTQYPAGNCFAACVASILDRKLENVDVDVASCDNSLQALVTKIEEKAKCKIYCVFPEAISDGIVKTSERYCLVEVCSFVYCGNPYGKGSVWHIVVCEISEGGKISLAFNPDKGDQRQQLEHFAAVGKLFFVKPLL